MQVRAVIAEEVNRMGLTTLELPAPQAGEVVVMALATGISPGTELRCLAGKQPGLTEFPFIPGYAFVGIRTDTGERVLTSGTSRSPIKTSWGAHMSAIIKPTSDLIPIPESVDTFDASIIRLAGIAYRGYRLAKAQPHETVVILGLGAIGQMSARLFRLSGARVIAVDPVAERRAVAAISGVETLSPEEAGVALANSADVVVDATGSLKGLTFAVELARTHPWGNEEAKSPRIVIQGSYPEEFSTNYQQAFLKELTFHLPRDVGRADLVAVLNLLDRKAISVKELITGVIQPEEADYAYAQLRTNLSAVTYVFDWSRPS